MPTGYTAKLMDKDQSFQDFVLGCAKAFGACIELRDAPADAPIPEEFAVSSYHVEERLKAMEEADKLRTMTEVQRLDYGQELKDRQIESEGKYRSSESAQNKRLKDMTDQVTSWRTPTEDFRELKKFMLNQLEINMHDIEYRNKALREAQEKAPGAYFVAALSSANWSVKYHTNEQAKEVERTSGRNQWITDLRNSIG